MTKKVLQVAGGLFFAITMIGILALIAIPDYGTSTRGQGRRKSCYAKIRAIVGAVEMYNMDASGTAVMKELSMERLTQGGYLNDLPVCPTIKKGWYRSKGDLWGSGTIECPFHGSPD